MSEGWWQSPDGAWHPPAAPPIPEARFTSPPTPHREIPIAVWLALALTLAAAAGLGIHWYAVRNDHNTAAAATSTTTTVDDHITASPITFITLGEPCGYSGYNDVTQVVAKDPDDHEVGFADLEELTGGPGHCVYKGYLTIHSPAPYFIIDTRSERRAGIRYTRDALRTKGAAMTLGDCDNLSSYSDPDKKSDCLTASVGSVGSHS